MNREKRKTTSDSLLQFLIKPSDLVFHKSLFLETTLPKIHPSAQSGRESGAEGGMDGWREHEKSVKV